MAVAPSDRILVAGHSASHSVDSLRELRKLVGKGQADIASALKIKQPSVSKIEKQTDMYLSTLRSYVEAVGGTLELTVIMPEQPALRIHQLGEASPAVGVVPTRRKPGPSPSKGRHG